MAETPNLTTILRQQSKLGPINVPRAAMRDAADEIESLERQIAELQAGNAEHSRKWLQAEQDLLAAEAENARLRALPLKDEVERVLEEGRKNTVAVMKALMATGSRDNLLLADAVHRADDAARDLLSRLRAGEQEGWRTECATEGCNKPATVHFERGCVGSYYCHDCYIRIQALPAAPSERGGDRG